MYSRKSGQKSYQGIKYMFLWLALVILIIVVSLKVAQGYEQKSFEKIIDKKEKLNQFYQIDEEMRYQEDLRMPWETLNLSEGEEVTLSATEHDIIESICRENRWEGEVGDKAYYYESQNAYLCSSEESEGYRIMFSRGKEKYQGYLCYSFSGDSVAEQPMADNSEIDDMYYQMLYRNLWHAHCLGIDNFYYIDNSLQEVFNIENQAMDEKSFMEYLQKSSWYENIDLCKYCSNNRYFYEMRKNNLDFTLAEYDRSGNRFSSFKAGTYE